MRGRLTYWGYGGDMGGARLWTCAVASRNDRQGESSGTDPTPPAAPSPAPAGDSPPELARGRSWKVFSWLTTVSLVLVLCFGVFIGYGLLNNRWYHVLAVQGGSMEPTISWGDVIVITKAPEELKPGMIVTMEVKDKIVTHRVLEVDPLVTQGDANGTPDTWKPEDVRVVGVVRLCIPKLGGLLSGIHLAGLGSNAWCRDSDRLSGEVSAGHWEVMEEDAMGAPDAEATLQARDLLPEMSDPGTGAELPLTSDPAGGSGESAPPPDAEVPNSVGGGTPTVPSTVLDPVEPSTDSSPPATEDGPTETILPAEDPVM